MANSIALFGGGFNPIGLHHEQIALLIYDITGMRTWFMPCYDHQFDKDSDLIDVKHRWNMVAGVANQRPEQMMAFDFEMRNKHSGSMYETMERLKPANPDIDFHIVIGMDNANCIKSDWDRGNLLIQKNPFIVIGRTGVADNSEWWELERDAALQHWKFHFDYEISSSDIRTAIAEGRNDFARKHLNPKTWDYIKSENLYEST